MRYDRRREERLPPLPKPYKFVRFPEGRADLCSPANRDAGGGHERFAAGRLTGTLEGRLTALSPVHVASGNLELGSGSDPLVRGHFRAAGRPTLPGSSLKGVFRSIVEAISNPASCARVTRARTEQLPANAQTCRRKDRLCLACRLFGAMGYLGRIRFRDAPLLHGSTEVIRIPPMFQPRSREGVYFEGAQVRGRKFYRHGPASGATASGNVPIEVCPRGSEFPFRIDFENLDSDELGLLLVALGQGEPPLFPKLGGGKPACCGSLRVAVTSVLAQAPSAMEWDTEFLRLDPRALASETRLVRTAGLEELRAILTHPGEGPCPDRNY